MTDNTNKQYDQLLIINQFFKENKADCAIQYIIENSIDPNIHEHSIHDNAALWLKDEDTCYFFEKITALGGNPLGHPSIMKSCIRSNKIQSIDYLLNNNVLEIFPNDIVYYINLTILYSNKYLFNTLLEKLDITKYTLPESNIPTCINVIIQEEKINFLNTLFTNNIIQPYMYTTDVANILTKCSLEFQYQFLETYANYTKIDLNKHISNLKTHDMPYVLKEIEKEEILIELPNNIQLHRNKNKI